MTLDNESKLIQEPIEKKKFEYIEKFCEERQKECQVLEDKKLNEFKDAFKDLGEKVEYIKTQKEIEIEIEDEVEDTKKIVENTKHLLNKLDNLDETTETQIRQSKEVK